MERKDRWKETPARGTRGHRTSWEGDPGNGGAGHRTSRTKKEITNINTNKTNKRKHNKAKAKQ